MKRRKLDYMPMPKPDVYRGGCKVSWHYYKDEATAKKAVEAAIHNAKIDESLGYDFGYVSPGSIKQVDGGMWEVVVS